MSKTLSPRQQRTRAAYIRYRILLAGGTQRQVAVKAGTTPATVSRVISGRRVTGEKSDAVWAALREVAKCPIHVLQDPPPPQDLPRIGGIRTKAIRPEPSDVF